MKVVLRVFVTPESVNVHNRKSRVLLRRNLNPDRVSTIMNQLVMVEHVLPVLPPPFFVKAPWTTFS